MDATVPANNAFSSEAAAEKFVTGVIEKANIYIEATHNEQIKAIEDQIEKLKARNKKHVDTTNALIKSNNEVVTGYDVLSTRFTTLLGEVEQLKAAAITEHKKDDMSRQDLHKDDEGHRREQRKAEQDEKNALTAKVEGLDNTVKKVVADNSKIIAVLNQQRARCAQPSGVVLQRHMAALTEHRRKAEAARARDEQHRRQVVATSELSTRVSQDQDMFDNDTVAPTAYIPTQAVQSNTTTSQATESLPAPSTTSHANNREVDRSSRVAQHAPSLAQAPLNGTMTNRELKSTAGGTGADGTQVRPTKKPKLVILNSNRPASLSQDHVIGNTNPTVPKTHTSPTNPGSHTQIASGSSYTRAPARYPTKAALKAHAEDIMNGAPSTDGPSAMSRSQLLYNVAQRVVQRASEKYQPSKLLSRRAKMGLRKHMHVQHEMEDMFMPASQRARRGVQATRISMGPMAAMRAPAAVPIRSASTSANVWHAAVPQAPTPSGTHSDADLPKSRRGRVLRKSEKAEEATDTEWLDHYEDL